MENLGPMIGGLFPTFLISRIVLLLLKSWDGGYGRLVVANGISLILCSLISGVTMAENSGFEGEKAFTIYLIPQCVWLAVDIWRHRLKIKEMTCACVAPRDKPMPPAE